MQRTAENQGLSLLAGAVAGALLTYVFDPDHGKRRRSIARDKLYSKLNDANDAARLIAKDLSNRAHGILPAVRHRLPLSNDVSDGVLRERVRSKLGRIVSHPGAIDVIADNGAITLCGPVLKKEVERLLRAVGSVPGVKTITNRLEPHERAEHVPALQGGVPRKNRPELLQEHWTPGIRFLAGLGGALLIYHGATKRWLARLLLVPGAAITARAATNIDLKRLLGLRGRRGVEFAENIYIEAAPDEVFSFWSNFENFPKFMRNVRAVRKNRDHTWHWEVVGPLGMSVEWDSYLTEHYPNDVIAWATTPGSTVQHSGIVRFKPEGVGTRVDVRMAYNPVVGALGHVVASLFGANPRAELEEDLLRVKGYFETGKPARDVAKHSAERAPLWQ